MTAKKATTPFEFRRHDKNETKLTDGIDMQKLLMSGHIHALVPDAEVTLTFKNRTEIPIGEYIDRDVLRSEFAAISKQGFADEEIDYFETLGLFGKDFIEFLKSIILPEVIIGNKNPMEISVTGDWKSVTFWETVIMSIVNERYFEALMCRNSNDLNEVYSEGSRRLDAKIKILKSRPDIKFAEFGTRRRFSYEWHEHVVSRLVAEVPENLLGVSNIWLAKKFDIPPIGTFAHEMPMVYAGLADRGESSIRASHGKFIDDWFGQYGEPLSIALSDTFGSDFFFDELTTQQVDQWRGFRHDSGDPILFGEKAINFYVNHGIDPKDKTLVFSDGLDIDTIVRLQDHFGERIDTVYGWGTNLTNDLGPRAVSHVMKATHVNGTPTVKLSDNSNKFTGPKEQVERYAKIFGYDIDNANAVETRY